MSPFYDRAYTVHTFNKLSKSLFLDTQRKEKRVGTQKIFRNFLHKNK